jgi:two-component system, chemotaxis family, chemotaxis protein CheY
MSKPSASCFVEHDLFPKTGFHFSGSCSRRNIEAGAPAKSGVTIMKTCLVVDDSSVIRKVARRILEGLDFQISEAENGEEAIEACRDRIPDAILLDWNMPKMDGYEFLRALRRLPGGDKPKVVFCTTENDVAHIARALHAGANEYIMKPFDKDIVEAKFQEVGLL